MWKKLLTLGAAPLIKWGYKRLFDKKSEHEELVELIVDELLASRAATRKPVTKRQLGATIEQLLTISQGSRMDLGSILPLVQSLLSAVTGGKSEALVAGTADEFDRAGLAAVEVSQLLFACRDAVVDGTVTWDEIQVILAEARDVPGAVGAM